jgi:hypothetical protein
MRAEGTSATGDPMAPTDLCNWPKLGLLCWSSGGPDWSETNLLCPPFGCRQGGVPWQVVCFEDARGGRRVGGCDGALGVAEDWEMWGLLGL